MVYFHGTKYFYKSRTMTWLRTASINQWIKIISPSPACPHKTRFLLRFAEMKAYKRAHINKLTALFLLTDVFPLCNLLSTKCRFRRMYKRASLSWHYWVATVTNKVCTYMCTQARIRHITKTKCIFGWFVVRAIWIWTSMIHLFGNRSWAITTL